MENYEEWRNVPGANRYQASSLGRIKGPRGVLTPSRLNSGYLGVKVAGRGTTVHAVVANTFIGPRPSDRHTVNHKNGCKSDNHPGNLEWLTQAENNRHAAEVLGKIGGRAAKPKPKDARQPITIDLSSYGGPCLRIEPRLGYISVRAIGEDGSVTACALKTLLHSIADQLPRTAGARSMGGMA